MTEGTDLFWNATLEEMKQGYVYNETSEEYQCLLCGQSFVDGVVYQEDGVLYEAKRFIRLHIENEHTSVFDYLLNLDKKMTGLTHHQRVLLEHFHQGLSDNEIVKALGGGGSPSTIRNHRFSLREKEKQAKVFLAIMELLGSRPTKKHKEVLSPMRKNELKNEYKQTHRPVGVFQMKNEINGKLWVVGSPNLDTVYNRHRFQLKMGGHPNKELQREWNEYGEENFSFEVLEQVKIPEGAMPGHFEYRDEMEALEKKWLEKLQPYGERGYNRK